MLLSSDDIRLLLKLLAEKTVVAPSNEFPYRITQPSFGYSDDPTVGRLQATLSIMLEVASKQGL